VTVALFFFFQACVVGGGIFMGWRFARADVVSEFIAERARFITAVENCAPGNSADYWRWQGHAEARRQLSERLAMVRS
jgi:hypothetical protein